MTGQIHQVPDGFSDAGLNFDYSVWTPGTVAQLCNVPWDAMYRDVVQFEGTWGNPRDTAALDAYLATRTGPAWTFDRMTYCKPGVPVRIPISFNKAWQFNYLRVSNPLQPSVPDLTRNYYYFINNVRYLSPNTTELDLQLDVWQTFRNAVGIHRSYIERGHIGMAHEDSFNNYGRDYLTVPEGLDIGNEYMVVDARAQMIAGAGTLDNIGGTKMMDEFNVVVVSTTMLAGDPGSESAPVLRSAMGSSFEGLPNGTDIYVMTLKEFSYFASILSSYPWVAQGIVSITAIPAFPMTQGTQVHLLNDTQATAMRCNSIRIPHQERQIWDDFRNYFRIPYRYRNLKKFVTYPYSIVEMTTYTGNPIVLKPECINHPHVTAIQMTHASPPSPRVTFYPYRYNAALNSTVYRVDTLEYGANEVWSDYGAEFMDMQCGIFDLPQFSVTNSGYLQYMAANRNSIAYGYQSADWTQQRALNSNQLSFDQASAGIGLTNTMAGLGIGAANESTGLAAFTQMGQGAASIGTGLAGGWMSGGMAGAALSAAGTMANTGLAVNQTVQQNAINNRLTTNQTAAQTGNMAYMRDTNKQFADWSARGDYANTIAGLNAKVQDAKLIQPTTAGQVGGDAFLLSTIGWGIHVKLKTIQPGPMAVIGDFWLRYGYAVNRWSIIPQDLLVMTKFSYWKLKETYIYSSVCPEYYKGVMRGIFEKGVTVWRNPDDIGIIDIADNEPIEGVVLY